MHSTKAYSFLIVSGLLTLSLPSTVSAECGKYDGPYTFSNPPPATLASGITVSVSTNGSVTNGMPGYRLGSTGVTPGQDGSVTFTFSKPLRSIRDGFSELDDNESVSYQVNGMPYTIIGSEIRASSYGGSTGTWMIGATGFLHVSGGSAGVLFEPAPSGGISSITITNNVDSGDTGGTVHDFYIEDCEANTPQLSVTKSVSPGTTLTARQTTTFEIEISETAGFPVTNVVVVDSALATILDASTAVISPVSCTFAALTTTGCDLGNLAANGMTTVSVAGDVLSSAGGMSNQATVTSDEAPEAKSNSVGPLVVNKITLGNGNCNGDSNNCEAGLTCALPSNTCLIPAGGGDCDTPADCAVVGSRCEAKTCLSPNGTSCSTEKECGSGLCDSKTMTCEACSGDTNKGCMSVAAPRCLTSGGAGTHVCVQCISQDHCPNDTICNASNMCVKGCTDSSMCMGDTPACDTVNMACAICANTAKSTDSDDGCTDLAPICVNAGAVSQPAENQGGALCSPCVNDSKDASSPATGCDRNKPICDVSRKEITCVECASDDHCSGATPTCDVATKTCVAECTGPGDCGDPDLPACLVSDEGGVCVQCVSDGDCPAATPACNTQTNTCAATCSDDTQCGGLTPVCNTTTGLCVGCLDNSGCTNGVCDTNGGTCVGCLTDGDCAGASTCDPATKTCSVPTSCTDNSTCSGTTPICDTGKSVCVGCLTAADCGEGQSCNPSSQTCQTSSTDGLTLTGGTCTVSPDNRRTSILWLLGALGCVAFGISRRRRR